MGFFVVTMELDSFGLLLETGISLLSFVLTHFQVNL